MPELHKSLSRRALEIVATMTPWILAMYVLYWLDQGQTWSTETAHRGKMAVTILVIGMGLSFLIYSRLNSRKRTSRKPS